MTISPYFFHVTSQAEQGLMKDLTRETIQLKGLDYLYIPRDTVNADYLFGEQVDTTFTTGVTIEMYCNEARGFGGEGDFMGKFGLDIRDEATFLIAKDRFTEVVTEAYNDILTPREGDLIYHLLAKSLFEITFVENEKPFFQRGIQTVWELNTKKFEYNKDIMDTGNAEVDALNTLIDPQDDKTAIQNESDTFVKFNERDPFSTNSY